MKVSWILHRKTNNSCPPIIHSCNVALRLYPPIPINARFAKRTTCLPRGGGSDGRSPLLIKRGSGVGFLPYYLHRRKDIYGEDAREFRPERWEEPGLAELGYAYVPFHGGPRLCLGSKLLLSHLNLYIF